jgi:hypothetical protein
MVNLVSVSSLDMEMRPLVIDFGMIRIERSLKVKM